MGTRRPSKAEIRRQREQLHVETPLPALDPTIASYIDNYTPREVDPSVWETVRPFVVDTICRYAPEHLEAGRQRLTALAAYAVWADQRGLPVTRERLLDVDLIEAFVTTADLGKSAAANYRSRLRGITGRLNPAGAGAQITARHAHRAVKAPYTLREVAAIVRIANTQPSATIGRQMQVCVGLGLGAGLDSVDLKQLRGRHVTDRGDGGIRVEVPEGRPRSVWVRRRYETMVRAGLDGVSAGGLLVGHNAQRRNVAGKIFANAHILGDAPHFEQSRMRTTWLAELLVAGVPLPVIMDGAGLTGARTLTDLLPYIGADADAPAQLRGVSR